MLGIADLFNNGGLNGLFAISGCYGVVLHASDLEMKGTRLPVTEAARAQAGSLEKRVSRRDGS